jgi:hypothetical protein
MSDFDRADDVQKLPIRQFLQLVHILDQYFRSGFELFAKMPVESGLMTGFIRR